MDGVDAHWAAADALRSGTFATFGRKHSRVLQGVERALEVETLESFAQTFGVEQVYAGGLFLAPPASTVNPHALRIRLGVSVGEAAVAVALDEARDLIKYLTALIIATTATTAPQPEAFGRGLQGFPLGPAGDAVLAGQFTGQGQ